jgi:hypothetical protein
MGREGNKKEKVKGREVEGGESWIWIAKLSEVKVIKSNA